ncbi:DUF4376 domain-containing protein [Candidatus Albibeggiatoa sp. nov. NOAA]|uniref:DUF4376 domain-containing protein n=1 Tax=Candidatus Albibeggiatoa sp. nov. NOAA TaxID=3162724 RepID=UPI0032F94062|nr:DUF4376 domain-containing protein [Thiotrichaceae bacterium]
MILVLRNDKPFAYDVKEDDLTHYPSDLGYDFIATGDIKLKMDNDSNYIYPLDYLDAEQAEIVKKKTASMKRRLREKAGVKFKLGRKNYVVNTDSVSQNKIASTLVALKEGLKDKVSWKMQNGEFVELDASQFASLAQAVFDYVQDGFSEEAAAVQ